MKQQNIILLFIKIGKLITAFGIIFDIETDVINEFNNQLHNNTKGRGRQFIQGKKGGVTYRTLRAAGLDEGHIHKLNINSCISQDNIKLQHIQ